MPLLMTAFISQLGQLKLSVAQTIACQRIVACRSLQNDSMQLMWDISRLQCQQITLLKSNRKSYSPQSAAEVMLYELLQGDKERQLGLPVSPLMDRALKGGMTRSQVF